MGRVVINAVQTRDGLNINVMIFEQAGFYKGVDTTKAKIIKTRKRNGLTVAEKRKKIIIASRQHGTPPKKGAQMGRDNLRAARKAKNLTQQQMADELGLTLRYYKGIEAGERLGSIAIWDAAEDLLGINQRVLREIHLVPRDNQQTRQENQQS